MFVFRWAAAVVLVAAMAHPAALLAQAATQTTANREAPVFSTDGGRYEGLLKDGKFDGKGRIAWPDGSVYEGEFADGRMSGLGRLRQPNDLVYEGEFHLGAFHGHGKLATRGDTYMGEFRLGSIVQGRAELRDGNRYVGAFEHDDFHGRGHYTSARGDVYEGEFRNGTFTGQGVMRVAGGGTHEGRFEDWRPSGQGKSVDDEGTIREGRFTDGTLAGKGTIVWKEGSRYEGDTRHGMPHGRGVMTMSNRDAYRGQFEHGQFEGQGTMTYATPRDGVATESGTWRWGRLAAREAQDRQTAQRAAESALYVQHDLLAKALEAIQPSEPSRTHMYLLAIAGDGSQEVFRREVEFVRRQFDTDYGTAGRSVVLVNSRNTTEQLPMASVTSVRKAVDAIARKMDREKDILFLFMTSHGSSTHEFSLGLRGMDLPPLTPKDLQAMLAASGIRWKVVVVSACYAGGYIDPLKNDHTLVIAAARHDRKSFGCADENDFTYFGRAFFKEALPKSTSFQQAFASADKLVEQWEAKEPRSLPQISDAKPIADRLTAWWKQRGAN